MSKGNWEARFQELVDYKRVHGNCNAPRGYKADPQLGRWVNNQRTNKEIMTEERRKRLNSIGFTWKVQEAQFAFHWEVRFQQLVDYKQVYGNCNVPYRYKANPHLGIWVNTQRKNKDTISGERRKQLDSIGFTWKVRETPFSVLWEVRFQELVDYKQVYGNCNVPIIYNANPQLGNWVRKQRTNKETMSEERRKKLNSIGFTWKVHISVDWEIRFKQLVDYKRVHGDCSVQQYYKENPQLGTWVMKQRTKKETMSENRRNQLNSIGFAWRLQAGRPKQQPRVRPSTVEDPKKKKPG